MSSHDWHVQLCCQRSELHTPKRAALDQGTTLRQSHEVVSSNLIALCWTGENPGSAVTTRHTYSPASLQCFARTFQDYRSLVRLSTSFLRFFSKRFQRQTPTTQMSKQRYVSNIESRSSRLLILHLQWLGFVAVGQSLEGIQLLHRGQTLGLRSVLPSVPCCMFPVDSGAKHLFLVLTSRTHQEYNNRIDCASP
jgi:hypothetical protein